MAQPETASTERVGLQLAQKWRLDKHLDEDPTLAADRDDLVPSQKAVREFVQKQWPVGSVHISVVATNPADTIGYGTWASLGGYVLVGYLAGDPDFGTPGATLGAKTKAISVHAGSAVADHADHTHGVTSNVTVAGHDNHTHTFVQTANAAGDLVAQDLTAAGVAAAGTSDGVSATLTHAVTNNAVTSAGASATLSHTVTQPSDHTALNVIQPTLVVYMWQRTA